MVHPCNRTLVGFDDNNTGCLTPHSNSAGTNGTMLFHGVDDSVDSGDKNLTHLTQSVDCCLKCKFNWCKKDDECADGHFNGCLDDCFDRCVGHVNDGKEDGADDSVDSGDKHLTHFTQAVDCCLMRMEGNACGLNAIISRSVLFGSANSTGTKEDDECADGHFNGCVDDCFDRCVGHVNDCKEDGADDSVDSGDKHLTHLTQFENNDNLGGCDKHLTHVVKKNSESLISDVTDDRDSIDSVQKDNDDKNNADTNIQSPSQRVSFGSTAGSQKTSNISHNHHNNYHNNLSSSNCSGFDCDGHNKYR
eukprot:3644363-Ditylum_brightwellii.AAC.1